MKIQLFLIKILFFGSLLLFMACGSSGADPLLDDEIAPQVDVNAEYDGDLVGRISTYSLDAFGRDAAYDGNNWVVVGEDIFISSDAIVWEKVNPGFSNIYNKILWNGELFIVVGFEEVLTSPDGKNWTLVASFTNQALKDIVWTGEEFLALAGYNFLYRSEDGQHWELLNEQLSAGQLIWTGDRLVALDDYPSKKVYLSFDKGATWSESYTMAQSNGGAKQLVFANGLLYGFGTTHLYKSADGMIWEETPVPLNHFTDFTFFNGEFYAIKYNGGAYTGGMVKSEDGIEWTILDTGDHGQLESLSVSETSMLATGEDILWSKDGSEWENRNPHLLDLNSAKWSIDRMVCTGTYSGVLVSKDLKSFELFGYEQFKAGFSAAIWTGSQYVAVGDDGLILTTENGSAFTSRNSGTNEDLNDLAFTDEGMVVVGSAGTLLFSPDDGITWENHSLNDDPKFNRVEILDGQFFAVGSDGVYLSRNGRDWEHLSLRPDDNFEPNILDIAFNGETYVAVNASNSGEIYVSNDAETWTKIIPRPDDFSYTYSSIEYTG